MPRVLGLVFSLKAGSHAGLETGDVSSMHGWLKMDTMPTQQRVPFKIAAKYEPACCCLRTTAGVY